MAIGTTLKISFDGSEVQRGFASLRSGAGNLAGSLAKIGVATVAAALVAGAYAALAFAKSSSTAAASIETLQTQFDVLLKSSTKAADFMTQFREEAAKSPLSIEDYAKAGKTILSFGVAADEVMPALKMLGDVSMGNSDRFSSLALAFAQTQAAGRLMGQEVLQFVNAGFNPLQEISKKTGRSMKDLKKDMEAGAISSDMVTEAFRSATAEGGLFYKALDRGSQTTEGKIAKLHDNISQLKVAFGTGFNDGLKLALDAVNSFLPKLMAKMKEAGDFIGVAIAEAVQGNYEKFQMIGEIIAEAIELGIRSGAKKMGGGLMKSIMRSGVGASGVGGIISDKATGGKYTEGMEKTGRNIDRSISSDIEGSYITGLSELIAKLQAESSKTQETKIAASEAAKSAAAEAAKTGGYTDINGDKIVTYNGEIVKILKSIDKKSETKAGAKM